MSSIKPGERMKSVTASGHFLLSLLFPLCGKPQHWGGQRQNSDWISAKSQPSSYTYPLHHSSRKTLSSNQACKILSPKSPTQQIRCPVKLNSSLCTAAAEPSKAEVSAATPAQVPVPAAPVHICFFCFSLFSLPNCN